MRARRATNPPTRAGSRSSVRSRCANCSLTAAFLPIASTFAPWAAPKTRARTTASTCLYARAEAPDELHGRSRLGPHVDLFRFAADSGEKSDGKSGHHGDGAQGEAIRAVLYREA